MNSRRQCLDWGFVVDRGAHANYEGYFSTKEIMQHRSAHRITLIDEQCGLDTTDLIEMSGLFPVTLIKRQVLILDDSLGPRGAEASVHNKPIWLQPQHLAL